MSFPHKEKEQVMFPTTGIENENANSILFLSYMGLDFLFILFKWEWEEKINFH